MSVNKNVHDVEVALGLAKGELIEEENLKEKCGKLMHVAEYLCNLLNLLRQGEYPKKLDRLEWSTVFDIFYKLADNIYETASDIDCALRGEEE